MTEQTQTDHNTNVTDIKLVVATHEYVTDAVAQLHILVAKHISLGWERNGEMKLLTPKDTGQTRYLATLEMVMTEGRALANELAGIDDLTARALAKHEEARLAEKVAMYDALRNNKVFSPSPRIPPNPPAPPAKRYDGSWR